MTSSAIWSIKDDMTVARAMCYILNKALQGDYLQSRCKTAPPLVKRAWYTLSTHELGSKFSTMM